MGASRAKEISLGLPYTILQITILAREHSFRVVNDYYCLAG